MGKDYHESLLGQGLEQLKLLNDLLRNGKRDPSTLIKKNYAFNHEI